MSTSYSKDDVTPEILAIADRNLETGVQAMRKFVEHYNTFQNAQPDEMHPMFISPDLDNALSNLNQEEMILLIIAAITQMSAMASIVTMFGEKLREAGVDPEALFEEEAKEGSDG